MVSRNKEWRGSEQSSLVVVDRTRTRMKHGGRGETTYVEVFKYGGSDRKLPLSDQTFMIPSLDYRCSVRKPEPCGSIVHGGSQLSRNPLAGYVIFPYSALSFAI